MMRIFMIVPMLCLSMAALAADSFDLQVANIELLQDKNIQKEVKITTAQHSKLESLAQAYNNKTKAKVEEYQKAKKGIDGDFQRFMLQQHDELRTNVLKELSAAQLKRLREITLQAVGPRALLDKAVAKKVGMSDAEFTKFRAAIVEGDQKIAKIKKQVSDKIRPKYANVQKPKTKEEAEKLQASLNKDLESEMHKHDAEMKTIIAESEKKTAAIVKKEYLQRLKALMGTPFLPPKSSAFAPKGNGKG
ncbi:MAG: hypothetical protein JST12_10130 [Armatimonadetes bacterium]|nr:hypothetical protein [Armatimonadota bacterium]